MDPLACLRRFLSAHDDDDAEETRDASTDLTHWLHRGGAAPEMTPEDHRKLWLAVSDLSQKALAWERCDLT